MQFPRREMAHEAAMGRAYFCGQSDAARRMTRVA